MKSKYLILDIHKSNFLKFYRESNNSKINWPYYIFILLVIAYSYFFLADGYNATDEGYLQSLGQRIVNGEQLYTDFYFFRPPLSVYIQAALIGMFGDSYSILAGRWVWTLQMIILVILLSRIYRIFVKNYELLILLSLTWITTSLLIEFQWYSYDAIFFSIIAIYLFYKNKFLWAGIAMFLSALSKQNYLLLLPGFLGTLFILQLLCPRIKILTIKRALKLTLGFIIPSILFLVYINWYGGGVKAFLLNVFTMPQKVNDVSLYFALLQDNFDAILKSIPLIIALVLWTSNYKNKYVITAASILTIVAIYYALNNCRFFTYELVYYNYTILIIIIIKTLLKKDDMDNKLLYHLLPLIAFGFVIQYLVGFNYSGLFFSYMGFAPAFISGWLILRYGNHSINNKYFCLGIIIIIIGLGLFYKYDFISRDDKRYRLETQFTVPKLAGIYSTDRNVKQIESIIQAIEKHSSQGDYIFIFPDFPSIFYLSNRKNPTKIGWFVMKEYNWQIFEEAILTLEKKPPSLIMLQQYSENDYLRKEDKFNYQQYSTFSRLFNWVTNNKRRENRYQYIGKAGDVLLFVPE